MMANIRLFTLIGAGLILSSVASTSRAETDPSIQCMLDLATKPEFAHISSKLPLGNFREISFAMLANDAVPTVAERAEIAAWYAGRDGCGKLGEAFRQSNYPAEVNVQLVSAITAVNEIGVDLYKAKITYGEANKRIAAARDELTTKVTEFVQQYKKELAAQQAQAAAAQAQVADARSRIEERNDAMAARAEDERRQRAQMIFNFLQANRVQVPAPYFPPPTRPVITNCTRNGNQTNCFSN
jgi:uncharacterized protein YeaO (DUF488 family)